MADTNFIDKVNIGLMLLAVLPALFLPFELFLFVYAVLGPLHYLTEINWLHKKQYFTTHRNDYLFMIAFIVIIGFLSLSGSAYRYFIPLLTFIVFFGSFGLIFFKETKKKLVFTILCGLIGLVLFYTFYKNFRILFSTLLPTIIHVFIFTGVFIVLGALKSKSRMGLASVIVFLFCAGATLLIAPQFNFAGLKEYIISSHTSFSGLNRILIGFFDVIHANDIKQDFQAPASVNERNLPVYFSDTGIRVMRFIAFAYTYHYLNWFSKTSVIQWHNTKKRNLAIIVIVWILSLALYLYDYKNGLKWLYILSFGHVVLEFPLNHISFMEIRKQVSLRFFR